MFHFHDPNPPDKLFVKEAAQNVRPGAGRGKDFRGYAFPEGAFPSSGQEVGKTAFLLCGIVWYCHLRLSRIHCAVGYGSSAACFSKN